MSSPAVPSPFDELRRRAEWPRPEPGLGTGRVFTGMSHAMYEWHGDRVAGETPETLLDRYANTSHFLWEDEDRKEVRWQDEPGGVVLDLVVLPKGFLPVEPRQLCPDGHPMPKDDGTSPDHFWVTQDREFDLAFDRYVGELDQWSEQAAGEGEPSRAPYYWDESKTLWRCTQRCGWLFFDNRFLAPTSLIENHSI